MKCLSNLFQMLAICHEAPDGHEKLAGGVRNYLGHEMACGGGANHSQRQPAARYLKGVCRGDLIHSDF